MKIKEIIENLENFAPLSLAEEWDNSGFFLGDANTSVNSILLSLDLTPAVIDEAINIGANLIITHHPVTLSPFHHILVSDKTGAMIIKLMQNKIHVYSMHTNLDNCTGGVNDVLAARTGLANVQILENTPLRLGRISPVSLEELIAVVKKELGTKHLRYVGDLRKVVKKVAVLGGSGGDYIENCIGLADVFVTADIKYHQAQTAAFYGLCLIDAGHFETENIILEHLCRHIAAVGVPVRQTATHTKSFLQYM